MMTKNYYYFRSPEILKLLVFLLLSCTLSGQVRYVKQGGTGNGSSWANASGDLQAMINASAVNDQVWVAAGTYQPASGSSFGLKNNVRVYGGFPNTGTPSFSDRNWQVYITILQGNNNYVVASANVNIFTVLDGFRVTGGTGGGIYNGTNGSPTLAYLHITGNTSSGKGGGICNDDASGTPILANLLIENNTAGKGGGIYNGWNCNPSIENVIVRNNSAPKGAGIYNYQCSPGFRNVVLANNTATYGGGIYNESCSSVFTNVLATGNKASIGGGIYTITNSAPKLKNSIIWGNKALFDNTVNNIYNADFTVQYLPTYYYSLIEGCGGSAAWAAGFGINGGNNIDADPLFADAANGNYTLLSSSPALNVGNTAFFTDAATSKDLAGNNRLGGTAIDLGPYEAQQPLVYYVKQGGTGDGLSWATASGDVQAMIDASVSGGQVWVAAGEYQRSSGQSFIMKEGVKIYGGFAAAGSPAFTDRNWITNVTTLKGNNATVVSNAQNGLTNAAVLDGFTLSNGQGGQGGGMLNYQVSPTISNLIVKNNHANDEGGGIYNNAGSPVFTNITITGNTVGSVGDNNAKRGGGFYNYDGSPVLKNVLVANNTIYGTGGLGGGVNLFNGNSALTNVTVANNTAQTGNGMYFQGWGTPQVKNAIVWGNTVALADGTPTFSYSLVQGSGGSSSWNTTSGTNGGNNIDADPLFIDAAAGNYTLRPCSPAYNTGNNSYLSGITTDVAGNTRVYGSTIDMGAYESQSTVPAAPTASPQILCWPVTVANLTGTALKWYTASTGGTALAGTTALATGTYYASQTVNGCESARTPVSITINTTASPTASAQSFCNSATVANLTGTGIALKWYSASTGGTALTETSALATGTYYVSQTIGGCESARTAVSVTVTVTAAPTAAPTQTFNTGATVASLVATGTGLQWYNVAAGGTALASGTILIQGNYYVSQAGANGCQSPRTTVFVDIVYPAILYVKPSGTGNGTSWANASGNLQAMINAPEVQQVWVATGDYQLPIHQYFTMKEGVAIYGGFPATGDPGMVDRNVELYETSLIGNEERVINNNNNGLTSAAVLDGFTIRNGKNFDIGGGGIINFNASPLIRNCIFTNNISDGLGGAVLNSGNSNTLIISCLFYNNRSYYQGGALGNFEGAYCTCINVTFADNKADEKGGAICNYSASLSTLGNCLFYGNTAPDGEQIMSTDDSLAEATYSLIEGGNAGISGPFDNYTPIIEGNPLFTDAANGNYRLLAGSAAIDTGNTNAYGGGYGAVPETDVSGNTRVVGSNIDIGAYERQAVAAPTATATQSFCGTTTIADLSASGTSLKWYAATTGGTALTSDTTLSTGAYYVSQTVSGYESTRTAVSVTINPVPAAPIASAQSFCGFGAVANLTATGTELKWYTASSGGSALGGSIALSTATYYVSQTMNGCESARTAISVSVNPIPDAPLANAQMLPTGKIVSDLTASGQNLLWYDIDTGGEALAASELLASGTYYVSQTVAGCESSRTAVTVTLVASGSTLFVKKGSSGSGLSWDDAIGEVADALKTARILNDMAPGTIAQIWVAGGTYKPMYSGEDLSGTDPVNRDNTFLVVKNVSLYGGFAGNEISLSERDLSLTANRSILSGDFNDNDTFDPSGAVTGGNAENAYHVVLVLFHEGFEEIDGFTIKGGNANGSDYQIMNDLYVDRSAGGGIFNVSTRNQPGPNLAVKNCVISGNTAAIGGGMFLGSFMSGSRIINTVVSGNNSSIYGGGLLVSSGSLEGTNATIVNNTTGYMGSGVYFYNSTASLNNTIIWGEITTENSSSQYTNCLIQGSSSQAWNSGLGTDGGNNISGDPMFANAVNGDFTLSVSSPAINAGNTSFFDNAAVEKDLAGNPRLYGNAIDIGAYEYPRPAYVTDANGVLYVKTGGTGKGSSWGDALGQAADALMAARLLNDIVPGTVTQVWVAGGTYKPMYSADDLSGANPSDRANAFVLVKDVKVYGGFAGYETILSQRDLSITANRTILSGDFNNNDTFGAAGNITGGNGENAYHVVIASEDAGTAALDGFAIKSGRANGSGYTTVNGKDINNAYGGGIFAHSSSPSVINVSVSGNSATSGAGMFIQNASPSITNALVAGNSSYSGGGLYITLGSPAITNATITGNSATYGSGIYSGDCYSAINNSIIWNNDIYGFNNGITYSNTMTADPMFTNAANGNYTLLPVSPAINAGNTALFANAATSTDIAGNPRVHESAIDIGAYESVADAIAPPVASAQSFCGDATVASLTATGTALKWYTADTGGTALSANTALATGTYYVSQSANGYESGRTAVTVTVNPVPVAPSVSSQTVPDGTIVDSLSAPGQSLMWYTVASGGTALASGTTLSAGTYYVSQKVNGCESARTEVAINVVNNSISTLYVKKGSTGTGASWNDAFGELADALKAAKELNTSSAGTITAIWVAGGTYKPMYRADDLSGANAADRFNTFLMVDGVSVYGGFAGIENDLSERDLSLTANASILSGDSNDNDTFDASGLVTGGNDENAYHVVLDVADGDMALDGFTIKSGNANTVTTMTVNGKNVPSYYGSGVYNARTNGNASQMVISNCIISGNGGYFGSGIYLATSHPSIINTLISGNKSMAYGGALYIDTASPHITNVTIANNNALAGSGSYCVNGGATLENTILLGTVYNSGSSVNYTNCLIEGSSSQAWDPGIGTDGGNNINADPLFTNAANGSYTLQQASPALNAGNTSLFANAATSKDLAGNPRVYSTAIDIGAYEYKPSDCAMTTVWNGTDWSNGIPSSYQYSAVIEGDYDSAVNGEITACSLTVNSGDVIISGGDNFTIKGIVTVDNDNASLTVQHNANLIQVDDVDNTGEIAVIKESAPMYRLDYAQWASPVANQTLKGFSPQTLDNRFYTYNPLSDAYATVADPVNTVFAEGKGYLIRIANNHPAYVSDDIAGTQWEGTFTGVPNNGDVNVSTTPFALPTAEDPDGVEGYNAIGNPYPSAINIAAFFQENIGNLSAASPIYFWRKKNDATTSCYATITLAGYNANTGNIWGDSSNGVFSNPNQSDSWVINSGQGFIVQATGDTVSFKNSMRVGVNNNQMFRSAQEDDITRSRLWLNLINNEGAFGQTTIAYTPATTLGLDYGWDGQALTDGTISIYSLAEEEKLGIQARPSFDAADEVPIEYKVDIAGSYSISLDHFDGVFAQGQEIYLRDNMLGVTHNLDSPYTFTTEAGVITGRFDVVYAEALGTDIPTFNSNSIIVYKQGSAINISTGNIDMKAVSVYDIRGRLLYSADNINAAATSITTLQAQEEMLIVEVTTVDGIKASRKIVF